MGDKKIMKRYKKGKEGEVGKMVEGEDYEIGRDGRVVMTRGYLLRRGRCCRNGCQNCPYGYSSRFIEK